LSQVNIVEELWYVLQEITISMVPLALIFVLFQYTVLRMSREFFVNALKGLAMAAVGLLLFLYGVIIGFLPAGWEIGFLLGDKGLRWVLIPVGFALGLVATLAEPAVRVLGKEVESQSGGFMKERVIIACISLGVAAVVSLAMARVAFDIPFHLLLLPGYGVVFFILLAFRPSFASLAFDSGGVATGPMTVTFIMAIAAGAAESLAVGDSVERSFGLVALVALAPICSIMIMDIVLRAKGGTNE
jgi:hypothetical protein